MIRSIYRIAYLNVRVTHFMKLIKNVEGMYFEKRRCSSEDSYLFENYYRKSYRMRN